MAPPVVPQQQIPSNVVQQSFNPINDPDFNRSPSAQDVTQGFDDGSVAASQTLTSQVNPWGQQTQTTQELAQAIVNEQQSAVQAGQPIPVPQSVEEINKLKKIIGDQGNTIGELRKLMGTLTERLVQNQPSQPQYTQPVNVNLFRNREPNDYPTAAEIQQALLSAGGELYQAISAKVEEVAVQAQLQAAGVTPEEATMIKLEYPSLAHLPASERNAVIAAVVKAKRAEANAATAATVQQATQTAQAGIRQQVYVPQPQPVSNIPQAGAVIDLDAFGNLKDANQMEQALRKMGIGRVNDLNRRG